MTDVSVIDWKCIAIRIYNQTNENNTVYLKLSKVGFCKKKSKDMCIHRFIERSTEHSERAFNLDGRMKLFFSVIIS